MKNTAQEYFVFKKLKHKIIALKNKTNKAVVLEMK